MNYITSAEVVNRDGKNYLQLFLNSKYPIIFKDKGIDREVLEIYFEEPNSGDEIHLRRCSIAINKLYKYMDQFQSAAFLKQMPSDILEMFLQNKIAEKFDEAKEEIINKEVIEKELVEDEEIDEVKTNFNYRLFIAKLLNDCSDYENSDSDYFSEMDKFISLLNLKSKREFNNMLMPFDLSMLDKYQGESFFIKKAIISEYVGFFFQHFPSQYLHAQGV